MIQLKEIELKNFMAINYLKLNFSQCPVHLFYGNNGSGKSSLLYAISLALVNYRKGDSFRDYVSYNQDYATVNLTLSITGVLHRIFLTIQNAENTSVQRVLEVEGPEKKVYKNSEAIQYLDNLLDINSIANIMLSLQSDFSNFVSLTPAKKTEMLQKIININFDSEINYIDQKIDELSNQNEKLETELNYLKSLTFEVLPLERTLPEPELQKKKMLLNQLQEDLARAKLDWQKLSQLDDFENLVSLYNSKKVHLENLDQKIQDLINSGQLVLENKNKLFNEVNFYNYLLNKTSIILDFYTNKKSGILEKLSEITTLIKMKKQNLADHDNGLCPRCLRPFNSHDRAQIENELNQILLEAKEINNKLDQLVKKIDFYNRKALYLKDSIKKANQDILNCENQYHQINQEIHDIYLAKEKLSVELTNLQSKIELVKDYSNNDYKLAVQKLAEKIDFLTNEKNQLEQKIQYYTNVIQKNKIIEEQNKKILKQKELTSQKIKDLEMQINNIQLSIENYKAVHSLFKNRLMNFIILHYCNYLENIINNFLMQIYPEIVIKIVLARQGIDIYYRRQNDTSQKFINSKMLSGFESQLLSLLLKISLAKLYNIRLLILDEIDSAANSQNSQRLFQLLIDIIQSENSDFDQVIIVSHKNEIKNLFETYGPNLVKIYYVENGNFFED